MFELASWYRFLVVYTLYLLYVHNSLLVMHNRYETDVRLLMNHIPWTKKGRPKCYAKPPQYVQMNLEL